MARLIDGDVLMNTLQKLFDRREKEQMFTGSRGPCVTWNDAIYHIKSAPTVDAVPVVRCKDCKWFAEGKWCRNPNNDMVQGGTTGEWFCADGKRREEDEP